MEISIGLTNSIDDDELFDTLKSIGYSGVDFPLCEDNWKDEMLSDEYFDFVMSRYSKLKSAELKAAQTHLPYHGSHLPPIGDGSAEAFEEYMLPRYIRCIELTGKINCPVAVVHLFESADREKAHKGNLKLIEKLLPCLEKNKVVLAIENIFGKDYSDSNLSSAEDLLFYTEHFDNPYLGICLDTGHALIRGQNPEEMLKKVVKRLKALHINSNDGCNDLHLIPYFESYTQNIDWKNMSDVLKENNYGGSYNMELQIPGKIGNNAVKAFYKLAFNTAQEILK